MLRRIILATALAAFTTSAFTTSTLAQTPPAEDGDKLVIEGMSIEQAVRSFVDEVGAAPRGHHLARWDGVVCAGAVNIKADDAQKLIDHVSLVALATGLEIGEPGCKPNVLIMANSDGDALATRLVDDHFRKFVPDSDGSNLGRKALAQFETTDAPVRWWHVSQMVHAETGDPIAQGAQIKVNRASLIIGNVRQDMSHVIIILDTTDIGSVPFASLADYVAMISLAQIDATAETHAYPSILNLFAGGTGENTPRMTQWDLDYLTSLHEVRGDAAQPRRQELQITQKMLSKPAAAGQDLEN